MIPDDVLPRIFSFLDEKSFRTALQVCREWRKYASDDSLWKSVAFKKWKSLQTDKDLVSLLERNRPARNRWRKIVHEVPTVVSLRHMSKFVCKVTVHQIYGKPVKLPYKLNVTDRFHYRFMNAFVLPYAPLFYLEPQTEADREKFNEFIAFHTRRRRCALRTGLRRFIIIPPCEYARQKLGYHGSSPIAVFQYRFP